MVVVRPVTPARVGDLEELFEAKGCPGYCWCVPYRFEDAAAFTKPERKAAMTGLVRKGTPVGVLAYDAGVPVGWCSIAPRRTFPKLARSKVMPDLGEEGVWTVTCLFVRRDHRGEGVAKALLEGAVRYARGRKARTIEAYPYDTAGVTATHMGHSSLYDGAGFVPDEGRRWVKRLPATAPRTDKLHAARAFRARVRPARTPAGATARRAR